MAKIIAGKIIEKVGIIDDDDAGREVWEFPIEESNMIAVPQTEPVSISMIDEYLSYCVDNLDAIVSDHHLKKHKNYFPINGADFLSRCYKKKLPSVLVTNYEQPDILEIRKYRQHIPSVLKSEEFNPESLLYSLGMCIKEFEGVFSYERKAWRSLIRIDDVDSSNIYMVIPSWDTNEVIILNKTDLPLNIQITIQSGMRLYAKVNIGAIRSQDLYFIEWEDRKQ